MISVNLTGVMNCMRAELQRITRGGGSIVNVSSTSGLRGLPHNAAYASSKFGAIGLAESAVASGHVTGLGTLGPCDSQRRSQHPRRESMARRAFASIAFFRESRSAFSMSADPS